MTTDVTYITQKRTVRTTANRLKPMTKLDGSSWICESGSVWRSVPHCLLRELLCFGILLCFTFLVLGSIFSLFFAIKNKFNLVFICNLVNLSLPIISLFILYFSNYIDDEFELKYGFYLLILNILLIIYFSKRHLIKNLIIHHNGFQKQTVL